MKSIRLVESNIAFAETTVSGGYDRFYIRSTTESPGVTVAHGTYADGTEIAVALQTALTTQASDLDVTVTYVDGRKFESGNDFTIDDTDVNATDSMGRSVTSGHPILLRRSWVSTTYLFHFQRHGLRSYSTVCR
jgi:hypothetical protein